MNKNYHHGNLRSELVERAIELIEQSPEVPVSLRQVARLADVSHGAAAHHFGDKRGLWTAVAAEGFIRLRQALSEPGDDFLEVAVAYVRFALGSPGLYSVMFDAEAVDSSDAHLAQAREEANRLLQEGVAARPEPLVRQDPRTAELAAFSLVHGLATLLLSGFIAVPTDPAELTRQVARVVFSE